jgi:hypothetical protein
MGEPGTSPPHQRAKSRISDNLRNVRRMACLAFAFWLAAQSFSELLDGWSPQHFLAERMITIVTDFRSEVVEFIFGGRNSGQNGDGEIETTHIFEGMVSAYEMASPTSG